MDYLTGLFSRVLHISRKVTNFEFAGTYHYQPSIPQVNEVATENHKRTLRHSFRTYLTSDEYDKIVNGYKRTNLDPSTITEDFFSGDIEDHPEPTDFKSQLSIEYGLQCMIDAFKPPAPARVCHLYDVQWHYPFKWQVNAEAPFSTEKYFLDLRKKFGDFFDPVTKLWTKYVNPLDALRRYGHTPPADTLNQVTPPKFGFMKNLIFSFVHSWQHVIKSRFTSNAGITHSNFLRQRFLFPMLLHIKTAIVSFDAPNKLRSIWGVSKLWIISEAMIYWEYIAWIKLNPGSTPMLWGYETFTGGWFRLWRDLHTPGEDVTYITIDWSRFDKRAYFWLIRKIFIRTRCFLDFTNGYVSTKDYPTSPTDPDKLQALWEWTIEAFFDSPIVLPDGSMFKRLFAGIPSGLFITQLMDSWYNYTMLAAILHYMGYDPRRCIIKVQGDDSIIRLYIQIPLHEHDLFLLRMQEVSDHLFGAKISFEKSELRNSLIGSEVLSYRNIQGLPYRDLIKMLAQFYHTKAKDPTPEITMAQAIGFAYAACGNDFRIHELLRSVYDYYKAQGFTPNPAGLTVVFGDSPDRPDYPISLDEFPSQMDVQRFFLSTDYRNADQENRTWPSSHFLYAPCSRI
ncbi:putative RNA-dependent RNA polymerase [Heterobasidion partitivirus 1]|uniref:Putative RNA-dependent RNA polymerase n=1 Tax=Heterobasidion partitivirus 1 TaxID=942041 RepID=E7E1E8_9VIRU|nr:putative RNA-dependent RNA polymerase [Heterobasidion partitivirus 1]ADV15441.1 putative RNA-dependent RNA polymerase [Heterobasidion partitivirus 1]